MDDRIMKIIKERKNKDGKYHHLTKPSIVYENGSKIWYQNGLIHRDTKAAIIEADGSWAYYNNGLRHRVNGPAKHCHSSSTLYFYQHDILHCADGPAVIRKGFNQWYRNGELHRIDGPAIGNEFYLNGKEYPKLIHKIICWFLK